MHDLCVSIEEVGSREGGERRDKLISSFFSDGRALQEDCVGCLYEHSILNVITRMWVGT